MQKQGKIIRDLTVGSVPRTLISFSLPLFLSGLLQLVYNMVDMIVVGNFVGTEGLSAVAIGEMVGTLFTLLEGLALVIMVVFLFSYQTIIQWLNTPPEIMEYTRQYSITCVWGVVFIYGYNLVSAILRGMGDSKHPFLFIALASLINVVLDLLFVGPLGMGPRGAALATVISQAVSALWVLAFLRRKEIALPEPGTYLF